MVLTTCLLGNGKGDSCFTGSAFLVSLSLLCFWAPSSFWGPLLFNIYMNDANFSNISCSLRFYADDTRWYSSSLCPSTLQMNLQNNLDLLVSWFRKNLLAIIHSKSQSMVFNRALLPTSFDIDSNQLVYVLQIKLLRVIIENWLLLKHILKKFARKWI